MCKRVRGSQERSGRLPDYYVTSIASKPQLNVTFQGGNIAQNQASRKDDTTCGIDCTSTLSNCEGLKKRKK